LPKEVQEALEDARLGKGHKSLIRRIHKLVAEREEERTQRMELEAKIESRKEVQPGEEDPSVEPGAETRTTSGVWDSHPEVAKIQGELEHADRIIRWARQNPDGGQLPDGKGGQMDFDADQVERILQNTLDHRTDLRADRRLLERKLQEDAVRQADEAHKQALEVYPWMGQKESPEFRMATEIMAQVGINPQAQIRMPSWRMLIGDLVAGRMAREGRGSQATASASLQPRKPSAPSEPTRQPGRPAPARRRAVEEAELEEVEGQFASTGKTADLAQKFAARRRARQAVA
jgi:hypothetical protein